MITYCPACGEILPDGQKYCDALCESVAGNPRPTLDSLRNISDLLDNYYSILGDIACTIREKRECIEAEQRRQDGATKRRFQSTSLEDALRKHESVMGDGRALNTSGKEKMREVRRSAAEIIAIAERERGHVLHAVNALRANHQVESYDYDNYISHKLPLPPDRLAIYCPVQEASQ